MVTHPATLNKNDKTIGPKIVVVNGCSVTYGYGLRDPKKSSWGRIVADALGADFVNLAAGGGSNQRLVRTTVEQLPRVTASRGLKPQEVLFLGMWTELPRFEVWDPDEPDTVVQSDEFEDRQWHRIGWWHLNLKYEKAIHYYKQIHHEASDLLNFFLGFVLLASYLENRGFHYGFILLDQIFDPRASSILSEYSNQINEGRLYGGWEHCGELSFLKRVSGKYKMGPRRHPLEEAHRAYANEDLIPWVSGLLNVVNLSSREGELA